MTFTNISFFSHHQSFASENIFTQKVNPLLTIDLTESESFKRHMLHSSADQSFVVVLEGLVSLMGFECGSD